MRGRGRWSANSWRTCSGTTGTPRRRSTLSDSRTRSWSSSYSRRGGRRRSPAGHAGKPRQTNRLCGLLMPPVQSARGALGLHMWIAMESPGSEASSLPAAGRAGEQVCIGGGAEQSAAGGCSPPQHPAAAVPQVPPQASDIRVCWVCACNLHHLRRAHGTSNFAGSCPHTWKASQGHLLKSRQRIKLAARMPPMGSSSEWIPP